MTAYVSTLPLDELFLSRLNLDDTSKPAPQNKATPRRQAPQAPFPAAEQAKARSRLRWWAL